jgi:hypothetical protein
MTSLSPLTVIFNNYVGQEVRINRVECISPRDTVIPGLKSALAALDPHLKIRIWMPDSYGDRTPRPDRVDVYIDKDPKGNKYRIQSLGIG